MRSRRAAAGWSRSVASTMTPSVPSEPDQSFGHVVARHRLDDLGAAPRDGAVGLDEADAEQEVAPRAVAEAQRAAGIAWRARRRRVRARAAVADRAASIWPCGAKLAPERARASRPPRPSPPCPRGRTRCTASSRDEIEHEVEPRAAALPSSSARAAAARRDRQPLGAARARATRLDLVDRARARTTQRGVTPSTAAAASCRRRRSDMLAARRCRRARRAARARRRPRSDPGAGGQRGRGGPEALAAGRMRGQELARVHDPVGIEDAPEPRHEVEIGVARTAAACSGPCRGRRRARRSRCRRGARHARSSSSLACLARSSSPGTRSS